MVVGGGSAGCALAGRLAAARACRVLLLEAGPVGWTRRSWTSPPSPPPCPATAPTGPSGRAPHRKRRRDSPWPRARRIGRGQRRGLDAGDPRRRLGPARLDLGGDARALRPVGVGRRLGESRARRRRSGPGRSARGALRHPAADRFLEAAATCGFPAEADKNAGGAPERGGAGQRRRRRAGQPGDGLLRRRRSRRARDPRRPGAADRHAHRPRRQPGGARRARRHPGRRRPARRRHDGPRG